MQLLPLKAWSLLPVLIEEMCARLSRYLRVGRWCADRRGPCSHLRRRRQGVLRGRLRLPLQDAPTEDAEECDIEQLGEGGAGSEVRQTAQVKGCRASTAHWTRGLRWSCHREQTF